PDPNKGQLAKLKVSSQDLAGLDAIIETTIGVTGDDLLTLANFRDQGNSIIGRLDQLSLSNSAFAYLLRIHGLAEKKIPISPSEWDSVYSILVQVQKQRKFAEWRDAEEPKNIALSHDFFKIPDPLPLTFPPTAPMPLPEWRATSQSRRDWQDTL